MPHSEINQDSAVFPLSRGGRSTWLASVAGESASILARYWFEKFRLDAEQRSTLNELNDYIDLVRTGLAFTSRNGSCLSFEKETLEGLRAKENVRVALAAENEEQITSFLSNLCEVLLAVMNFEEVDKDYLVEFNRQLTHLSELAGREVFHPEATHQL